MYEQICKTSRFNYQKYVCVKKYNRIFSPRRSTKTVIQSSRRPLFVNRENKSFHLFKNLLIWKTKHMLLPEENKCYATKITVLTTMFLSLDTLITGMHSGPPQNQRSPGGTGGHRTAQWNYWRRPHQKIARVRGALFFQTDILSPTFPLILFSWSFRIAE